ncbi:YeiH family protein [Synoicihabitans lomoniglobus]|uniref:Sulfate exporter family transporter n=1 Tax=Synoicihabitans lomoniglobus TaxID=2909285 RepID=A0AAF0CQ43_9BACT|nr:putative sulfate exporter family transporter [Opitutaceae bacterium LMO-M01]WED65995.1 putative sulfate exporter family transporter [Opitutaceae bacterium LMO-M01]
MNPGTSPARAPVLSGVLVTLGAAGALVPGVPPWLALLMGAAIGLSWGPPTWLPVTRIMHTTLQLAVVGIGAGINLAVVGRVGLSSIGYTMIGLVFTLIVGVVLAKRGGVGPHVGALLFAGTGICGGSAIAAVAPAIRARADETSASISTVFLLNAVALLIFPALGRWLGLDPGEFGLWCALAIHDTSSVVGAALTGGPDALVTATTVKLVRSLWIVPVTLALGFAFRRIRPAAGAAKLPVPWFIGGFVLLSAMFTAMPALAGWIDPIAMAARALLSLTLFLIGLNMSRAVWRRVGYRALLVGVGLWIAVATGTLLAIKLGWISQEV